MIVFDLRCTGGHVFEAWFASSNAFEEQRERSLVACPMCGSSEIANAVMAPRVAAKGNSQPSVADVKRVLADLAAAQATALKDSRWVGRRFADEARAMHVGDTEQATIHGQATREEAAALVAEGVPVAPLPFPVAAPDELN